MITSNAIEIRSRESNATSEWLGEIIRSGIINHWEGMLCDTSEDDETIGGQSVLELERIELFEEFLLKCDACDIPTFHHFSDGIYVREIHAPREAVIIGHEHRYPCLNVMSEGRVNTIVNGTVRQFVAPCIVESGAHTRKASIVIENMRWATIHPNPTNETDISKLEDMLLIKSASFIRHENDKS